MPTAATKSNAVTAAKLLQELQAMDAGVLKDIPARTSLTLNGTAMTQGQIDTQLKSYVGTVQAAATAKTQYQAAVVARKGMTVEARDFYLQLKKAVIAYFGAQSAQLTDFGLTPAKAKVAKTSAQKALSQAKLNLTRAARGTTSKKQKAAINPGVAQPAVAINAQGELTPIPPTVIDGAVPSGSSTPASSAPVNAGSPSAPATPAGSGSPASNA